MSYWQACITCKGPFWVDTSAGYHSPPECRACLSRSKYRGIAKSWAESAAQERVRDWSPLVCYGCGVRLPSAGHITYFMRADGQLFRYCQKCAPPVPPPGQKKNLGYPYCAGPFVSGEDGACNPKWSVVICRECIRCSEPETEDDLSPALDEAEPGERCAVCGGAAGSGSIVAIDIGGCPIICPQCQALVCVANYNRDYTNADCGGMGWGRI